MKRKLNSILCFFIVTIVILIIVINNNDIITAASKVKEDVILSTEQLVLDKYDDNDNKVLMEDENDIVTQSKANNTQQIFNEQKRVDLENKIKAYLGNNINNIGLSYYDIDSNKQIVINGDKQFLAASTVKVQMNMILFDMIESGQVKASETLKYTSDCYEDGTGILQSQDLSKPLSIKLLSNYSIIYSDNIATNMIMNRIGYNNMRNLIDRKLGHATDHSRNYITANDETTLLKLLYYNYDNNPFYSQLIETMKKTVFHDRIDLYIPHNTVAHKIGNYESYVNDVGIIFTEDPYILSIYSKNVPNANEIIAHISKLIYDYQNQN
ncbi:serine hydrolase [Clostridium polyendosporum]|uniref:Serine hydrolase n=1 Tax=Clostridium polyendosporum TaxID=69208 RepID=A0A919S3B5_9CLOT|nr:serine hydrolase [Clostridium polyendosporum]GIM30475.1 serine hydrolase [Clostridium polyendosporum]